MTYIVRPYSSDRRVSHAGTSTRTSFSIHLNPHSRYRRTGSYLHSYGQNGDATTVLDHLRSEIMVRRNGKAIEIPKDSLLAMESVKLQNGRPDLSALLRDEVDLATGRMSVSGQSSRLKSTDQNHSGSTFGVWLADDRSICLWCSSVPTV